MVKSEIKFSWRAPEALRKDLNSKKWLSFQSHQPSVWYLWPKPTRGLPKRMGVSHLEPYHLRAFPRNQKWHFQSWIQITDLRNVVHYAVDWKKAHIVQANVFLELISLLCLLPPKRCQQSVLPLPKLAVPTSSWGQSEGLFLLQRNLGMS